MAQQNLTFLERPEIRAGLLQLGISLLTPRGGGLAGSLGTALGEAGQAVGRYQQQSDIRSRRQRENILAQQVDAREQERLDEEIQASQASTDLAGEQEARLTREGKARIRQGDRELDLSEERDETLRNYYNGLVAGAGSKGTAAQEKAILESAISIYNAQTAAAGEAAAFVKGIDVGELTLFDQNKFTNIVNTLRRASGFGPVGGKQTIDADAMQRMLDAGERPEDLLSLQEEFYVTPEAKKLNIQALIEKSRSSPRGESTPQSTLQEPGQIPGQSPFNEHLIPNQLPYQTGVPAYSCLLYTSPSPRDRTRSRMPSSA